jgi:hypothetical protein
LEPRTPAGHRVLARRWVFAGIVLFAAWTAFTARADEIRFRSRDGAQSGTVLEENGRTVTVRFPREAIESIRRSTGEPEGEAKREPAHGLEERVRDLERKVGVLPASGTPAPGREAEGRVEGVIRWKDRPLSRGRVMIVLAKVAGLPPESREKAKAGVAGAPGGGKGDKFETETDAAGRYRFERVPPGEYLFYWMPSPETGWIRRLRDKPDLEVTAGGVAVLNIPADKK